jgi:hypothetical protein
MRSTIAVQLSRMNLIARPATPGLWLDLSVRCNLAQAKAIIAEIDPIGVIRTLPLPNNNTQQDINAVELEMWCSLGREVMAYQHVRATRPGMPPGWDPRNHSGEDDGAYAAEWAVRCGFPPGVHMWCDWEDLVIGLPPSFGKVYLEGWAGRQLAASFATGEYCGFDDPMSPQDRYELHGVTSYWSDAGHRTVATRGTAIVQGAEKSVSGIRVDLDQLAPDLLGDVPWACAAAPDEVA